MSARKAKSEGVEATNRDYIDYEQVSKDQTYSLAEQAGTEEFDDDFEIRTCDLSRFLEGDELERAAFSQELGTALHEIGFAILVGQASTRLSTTNVSARSSGSSRSTRRRRSCALGRSATAP